MQKIRFVTVLAFTNENKVLPEPYRPMGCVDLNFCSPHHQFILWSYR